MFRFKVSKFKNAAPKFPKREQCFTDAPIGTMMNSAGNHIAASCKFIAFNSELGGGHGIGVVGLEDYGRLQRSMPIIHGHSDFVSDMHFSPFDDCMLATGSFDGEVKVWKLPEEGLVETLSHGHFSMPACKGRVENVLFHPAANNVLSVTSQSIVSIYDVERSSLKYEIDVDSEDQFQSFCWKPTGDLLVTSCKDTNLRIIDPRASAVVAEGAGHPGIKDSKTVWLGDTDSILSAGFGKGRDRSIGIWDTRNFQSPVTVQSVDNAGGILLPFYDPDTNMLLVAGKGDSKIYFFEVTEHATKLSLASSDNLEAQTSGMTMIPKRACHLMQAEVNRLLQVTKNSIIPLSYIVPRRSYTEFYPELFPDTLSGEPSMTADQWFDGANEPVSKIKLDPKKSKRQPAAKVEKPQAATPEPTPSASEPKHEEVSQPPTETKTLVTEVKKVEEPPKSSPISTPPPQHKSPAAKPKAKFHGFRVPKFKHLTGKLFHKSQNIENIKNFDQSLAGESDGLHAYNDLVAYPIAGPGGQIAVVKLSNPGRLPDTGVPVLQNPSALLDFAMNPFNNHIIAAACEDSHIRIWTVPEDGLEETLEEPTLSLVGHHSKVNMVRFNPCVDGVIASASYDQTVKIWNINTGDELFTLEEHPDHLLAMSWHPDGHLLATIGRDCMIRVFDPRQGVSPIATGKGPEGPRGARVVWGGPNNEWLIVSGFTKGSKRCINVYDSKKLDECLGKEELQTSPAILMLFYDEDSSTVFATGRGDRNVLAYEISSDSPHIFALNPYAAPHQHQGIAFLRKDLCDVREIEFTRAVRVSKSHMEQIAFHVPRVKKQFFQDDLFPDTRVRWEPSVTCEQWLNGENVTVKRISLMPSDMKPLHTAAPKATVSKYEGYQRTEDPKSLGEQKEELLSSMMDKLTDLDDRRSLEQDKFEGVEEGEWLPRVPRVKSDF
eukprot:gene7608-8448_t